MTKRNIFCRGFDWAKVPDKPFGLFKVTFKNEEFTWWPEWEEVLRFEETATRLKTALLNWVNKKTQEERQRIIDLLNRGDFREAGKLLQSGVVEMAEWLKTQSEAEKP